MHCPLLQRYAPLLQVAKSLQVRKYMPHNWMTILPSGIYHFFPELFKEGGTVLFFFVMAKMIRWASFCQQQSLKLETQIMNIHLFDSYNKDGDHSQMSFFKQLSGCSDQHIAWQQRQQECVNSSVLPSVTIYFSMTSVYHVYSLWVMCLLSWQPDSHVNCVTCLLDCLAWPTFVCTFCDIIICVAWSSAILILLWWVIP